MRRRIETHINPQHQRRHDDPRQRFEQKYVVEPNTGCWLWIGCLDQSGYPAIWLTGWNGSRKASRMSYELYKGRVQKNACVCHKCDMPLCVNPEHLFLGTQTENISDRTNKQRSARGEKHGNALLTETQVLDIRQRHKAGETMAMIARSVNVSHGCVSLIVKRKAWKHV